MSEDNESKPEQALMPYRPRGVGGYATTPRPTVEASFDPQTPDGARKLVQGTMMKLPSIKSQTNKMLAVVDILSHDAQTSAEKDGEVKEFRRTVLYTEQGDAFDCGSMGVDKAVSILSLVAGPPPWKPPINVTVTLQDLGGGRQWLTLTPDLAEITKRLSGKNAKSK